MSYEINVSRNGSHVFATHERSLTDTKKARETLYLFKEKFPEKEGYNVTISYKPLISYNCWLNEKGELLNHYYDK